MKNIAIFASGTGSNARRIVEFFEENAIIRVALIISNKPKAKVLEMASSYNIPSLVLKKQDFYESEQLLVQLADYKIDFIALAGFLWLIPPYLVSAYHRRMINIHPALLPKYGGKGMYGMNVHETVKTNAEQETGITLHFVNEQYDEGDVIFQASCPITPQQTALEIRNEVLKLEHYYFSRVLSLLV